MNTYGRNLKLSIFGQSHSEAIGMTIDGLPAGFRIDMEALARFCARRAPGQNSLSTTRKEADTPEFISGLWDGVTCGAPLCAVIRNGDVRSKDYDKLKRIPRPAHADYAAYVKFGGCNDIRGGGQFSGRLTAPLCVAGGVALQILASRGIYIGAHVCEIAGIKDDYFDPVSVTKDDFLKPDSTFPSLNSEKGQRMAEAILEAKHSGDSVGGIIECAVVGMEAGYGSPMFDGVENVISQIVFGIPAVKGIEFGLGFEASRVKGSVNNDAFAMKDGKISTKTNNSGGILGGITNGMPIIFRAAFKPTPSIAHEQDSVDLYDKTDTKLIVEGRHDPCVVVRAVPAVEAAAAIAVLDMIL